MTVSVNGTEKMKELKACGADAVLIAAEGMSFSLTDPCSFGKIRDLIPVCHEAGLDLHINLNALFAQGEVEAVRQYLKNAIEAGADGFWFSDPMLMRAAKECGCVNRMVYHPMTLVTNTFDADWWMKKGLLSAVISPLLTAKEILRMISNVSGLTVQIHGRSLMSVSARSLLGAYEEAVHSAALRGKRDLFLVEEKRDDRMPVFENGRGTMVFTDFIQESFHEIREFAAAGDCRFLLEGSGMTEEEILDALQGYTNILNGADPEQTAAQYREKYPDLPLSKGYYEQETIK